MNKVVYITAMAPFGTGEAFLLKEMIALKELGVDLLIIPRDATHKLFHKQAEQLHKNTLAIPWFAGKIIEGFIKCIWKDPHYSFKLIWDVTFKARNIKIGLKNLIILPKAIYLSAILKEEYISHIHAHWGSTTSTIAYIISKSINIPWSFTVHRWDIQENNLLKDKCKTASFVRTIDENGRKEVIEVVKDRTLIKKISVIHMGVDVPKINERSYNSSEIFTFLCPANFVFKKGHRYLFDACRIMSDNSIKFKCLIAGEGPLEDELKGMLSDLNLGDRVKFLGRLSHETLFDLYDSGKVNAIVLPSIITEDGEKEGIPVALMEAMSYGIPIISTNTGGIPELIGDGCGIMVEEKNPDAICIAIEKLRKNPAFYNLISERGREKIEREFNISPISRELLNLFGVMKQDVT